MSFKQYNYKAPIKKEGCCFCCDCYLAGLNGNEIEDAFDFGVANGYVRGSDCYVLNHGLIDALKSRYGRSGRSGRRVNVGGHFVVQNSQGQTIFNPA